MRLLIIFMILVVLVTPAISNRNAHGNKVGLVSFQRASFQSSQTPSKSSKIKVSLSVNSTVLKRSHNGNQIKVILGPVELLHKASGSNVSHWTKY